MMSIRFTMMALVICALSVLSAADDPAFSKDGLSVTDTLDKTTLTATGPLAVTLHFANTSDQPLTVWNVDGYHWREWSYVFKVQGDGDWKQFEFEQSSTLKPSSVVLTAGKNLDVTAKMTAGDLDGVARILSGGQDGHIAAGTYEMAVRIEVPADPDPKVHGWSGRIETTPVTFTIVDPPAKAVEVQPTPH
jgi:hypothetical protein